MKRGGLELIGYCDSDYGGDAVERKSTSGYIYFLNKAPVSWCSKKQTIVVLSSYEAEYVAGCYAACQGIWLKELLAELKVISGNFVQVRMDNTSAVNLARNPVSHGRSKHIEVKYHFLRDMVNKGRVELSYCKSEEQWADLFTKSVAGDRFEVLKQEIGVVSLR
ncbi:hypothetical protein V8G54_000808 [Vigna mungo]|uniref:Cationic amino acid transporter 1-like n=1 Tax=Vigna mungo TaxID=3915 RepID=A0AAQ3SB71_VIGMU